MDLATILERYGDGTVLAIGGLTIGGLFGFFAQRSRFCLRAAVIEFWHHSFGEKLSVWLLAFATSVIVVQALLLSHNLDISSARQIATRGSLSGALVGGLFFGAGMIMTRGCASRLLVLSANGNLRALLSGLIFAVAAQASLSGALSPLRATISSWWTVDAGPSRDLLAITGLGPWGGLVAGLVWMAAALYFSWRSGNRAWMWLGGLCTGLAVALAWWFNHAVAQASFDVVPVGGLTFSGPSAEWLMRVLANPGASFGFDSGMLPAVSWQRLMANLPKHFGTDASLDPATNKEIATWLHANAGTYKRVTAEAPPEDRISRSPWFIRKHDEVAASVWQRPAIKSAANCSACHPQADKGDFNERSIRIPK